MAFYRLNPNVIIKPMGEAEIMVYDSTNGKVHVLNETAGFLLNELSAARDAKTLCSRASATYGVNLGENDLNDILRQFLSLGLIVEEPANG